MLNGPRCHFFCKHLAFGFYPVVLGACSELLLVESGIANVVALQEHSWLLKEIPDGLLLHLSLHYVPVLIAQGAIRQINVLPLAEVE
jgi:hypothetical protein